jgi:hypothetical protein
MALIGLPTMHSDTALLVTALALLVALATAVASIAAWRRLASLAARARRRRERMDDIEARVHAELDVLRRGLQSVNADVERALWWLPRLDARLADTATRLGSQRDTLKSLAHDEGRAMRTTIPRIRGTLDMLGAMRDLRRTILG